MRSSEVFALAIACLGMSVFVRFAVTFIRTLRR
jgi:hypothetical protein